MGRGTLAVFAWIGLLIALGLIVTHSQGFTQVENATFSGIGATIRDLQLLPQAGTHKS
ncbi:MAG: hypothetical protein ACJ8BW_23880 [Ktedonobacteraceae bacterium]